MLTAIERIDAKTVSFVQQRKLDCLLRPDNRKLAIVLSAWVNIVHFRNRAHLCLTCFDGPKVH